ncbi:MAG: ribonuclease [Thermoleophilia bacterium]|nr:ribonuclease [Thermoleophilia bacterium]
MGLFDKVKKAISGGSSSTPSKGAPASGSKPASGGQGGQRSGGQGGQRSGGQGGGGNRNRNRNRGGQGGQGGQSGEGRQPRDGEGEGTAGGQQSNSGNRRRGSRGGRGRSGQGGEGTATTEARTEGTAREGGEGSGSSANRRRRGGRGRGSGQGGQGGNREGGQGGQRSGGQQGTTRKVTRSNAGELKEQQEKEGGSGGRSGGQRKRSGSGSGSGNRSRSGGRSGSGGNRNRSGGGRERTRRGSASSGSNRRVLDANERPKNPVKKQILINSSDPNEIRIAIREQQKVVEVYVERKGKRSLAGNIYKGRVQNVLRGMEAAFIDIGLERNGFLYVDEITPAAADSDQVMRVTTVADVDSNAGDAAVDVAEGAPVDTADLPDNLPSVDADAVEAAKHPILEPGTPAEAMAIAAAENDETLDIDDAMEEVEREEQVAAEDDAAGTDTKAEKSSGRGRARIQNKKKIQELLKQGQEILCQVVKDPMGTKGSRLTTQYSLAGRYLVYVPDGEGLGVSRRLEDAERNRLRDIVKQFELPAGGGLIVRTAAEGGREEDIAKDLQLLLRLHEQLMDKAGQARAPKLLYNEADLSLRIIRDLMNDEVEEVLCDDDRQYQRIMNYLKRTAPVLAERVRMHDGQRPLFESYGVEEAIRSTLSKRAELPSGGYLIIDYAEAFTVIDVNTGRSVGTSGLEETITNTNMEAAEEVVRQLRLRDIGGIIVVDFIDMNLMKNRDMVLEHFRKELSKDRTKTYLVEISPLGLVEMTRQNVSEGVREILTSTCTVCEGRGVVVSPETHAIEVERAVVELAAALDAGVEAVAIETEPGVAKVLAGNTGKQGELNKRAGKNVRVFADPDLTSNTFAVRATGAQSTIDSLPDPLQRGTKHKVLIERVDPANEADGLATIDGVLVTVVGAGSSVGEEKTILIAACSGERAFATLVKPARRRRRRGGRGRKRTTAGVGAAGDSLDDAPDGDDDEGSDGELAEGDEGEFEEDDFEDEDEDDAEAELDPEAAAIAAEEDIRTEILPRLVVLQTDEDELDDDDDEDDDPDDDGSDDDGGEDDGGDDEGGDDEGDDEPAGSTDSEDADDDEASDEDSYLDPTTANYDDEDDPTELVRRTDVDDRDEPSIDADGDDDHLNARGLTAPKVVTPRASEGPRGGGQRSSQQRAPRAKVDAAGDTDADADSGDADSSSAGQGGAPALNPDGTPKRRRRRGSRGGRGRSRTGGTGGSGGGQGSGGANGGGQRSNAGGSGGGSTSSTSSNAPSE